MLSQHEQILDKILSKKNSPISRKSQDIPFPYDIGKETQSARKVHFRPVRPALGIPLNFSCSYFDVPQGHFFAFFSNVLMPINLDKAVMTAFVRHHPGRRYSFL